MAAPTKRALTTFANGLAPTSPASTEVDDLVVVVTATSTTVTGIPSHTLQTGFTEIGTQSVDDGATDGRVSVAYKVATSAGANTYQAYTASTGTSTSGIFVITKATYDVSAAPPWASTSSTTNGAPNPPALTSLTGDFLFLALGVWVYASATANTPTAPANYALEDHLAGSAINDPAYCSRSLTGLSGSTEDPAAITDNTAPACTMAATLAIKGVGPVNVTPTAASSQSSASTPTITYGAFTVTPTAASSASSASSPTITMGAITVTPTTAVSQGTASDPTVEVTGGGQTITPTVAISQSVASSPMITMGAITVTPAAASSQSSVSAPTITYGAFTFMPITAASQSVASAPALTMGAITVTPTVASSQGTASNPTVTLGQTITPAAAASPGTASAPTVTMGAITVTPTAANSAATAHSPDVSGGGYDWPIPGGAEIIFAATSAIVVGSGGTAEIVP